MRPISPMDAGLLTALRDAYTHRRLEEYFNSPEFKNKLLPPQDVCQWAIGILEKQETYLPPDAIHNPILYFLLKINTVKDFIMAHPHFTESLVQNHEWAKLDMIIDCLKTRPLFESFVQDTNLLSKILEKSSRQEEPFSITVMRNMIAFPNVIEKLDDHKKKELFFNFFRFGKYEEIVHLLRGPSKQISSQVAQQILYDLSIENELEDALLKNNNIPLEKKEVLTLAFVKTTICETYPIDSLFEVDSRWINFFIQYHMSRPLNTDEQMKCLENLFKYKSLSDIEWFLQPAEIYYGILLEEKNLLILKEALAKNQDRKVFDLYMPLLQKIHELIHSNKNKDSLFSTDQNAYRDTKNQLEVISKQPLPSNLKGFVSETDFKKTLQYLIDHLDRITVPTNCELKKEQTHLKNTLNIICLPEGKINIFLEIKSKTDEGEKKDFSEKGAYKIVKPSYEILSGVMHVNLIQKIRYARHLFMALQENRIACELKGDLVDTPILGRMFQKRVDDNIVLNISSYSEKAQGTLRDLLYKSNEPISIQTRWQLFLQVLYLLKMLQEKGVYHQDIKLENILVFKKDGKYILKLSDFGLSGRYFKPAKGASAYIPPEVMVDWRMPGVCKPGYAVMYSKQLGGYLLDNEECYKIITLEQLRKLQDGHASDSWAAGILGIQIIYSPPDSNTGSFHPFLKDELFSNNLLNFNPQLRKQINPLIEQVEKIVEELQDVAVLKKEFVLASDKIKTIEEFSAVLEKFKRSLENKDGSAVFVVDVVKEIKKLLDNARKSSIEIIPSEEVLKVDLIKNNNTFAKLDGIVLNQVGVIILKEVRAIFSQSSSSGRAYLPGLQGVRSSKEQERGSDKQNTAVNKRYKP